jgi:hypothetical protein
MIHAASREQHMRSPEVTSHESDGKDLKGLDSIYHLLLKKSWLNSSRSTVSTERMITPRPSLTR